MTIYNKNKHTCKRRIVEANKGTNTIFFIGTSLLYTVESLDFVQRMNLCHSFIWKVTDIWLNGIALPFSHISRPLSLYSVDWMAEIHPVWDIGVQRTGLEEEQGGHSHLIIVWKAGWQWFYCCKMHLSTTVSGYLK